MKLFEMFKAKFITDKGKEHEVTNDAGEVIMTLNRYAVWGDMGRGKAEVIETGSDLEALKKKYNIDKVVKMPIS